ncbi:sulfatase [Halorubrum sp. Ea1]|uniref:sulfatase n=1 Tax=Halorubrum sp. Ea1 TaxID=1480718 RepID=UPI000B999520|nr:sulfatase [Halorubrum sp. Ea1]OYR53896.1 sulfatase [Halorubrum sp. Ea1]
MKNIVLLVMDTARYDYVSNSDVAPNINQLADNGTDYTSSFSAAPWTLPSHASIFSGQYPSKHGSNAAAKRFNPSSPSFVEALQNSGYETIGVSNNTWISEEFGFDRGFTTFYKNWQYIQSGMDPITTTRKYDGKDRIIQLIKEVVDGNPLVNFSNTFYALLQKKRIADDGARSTNEWISQRLSNRDRSNPLFLFVNYFEPHLEYRPPKEYTKQFLPDEVSYNEAMEVEQDAFRYIAGDLEMDLKDFEILRSLYRGELSYLDMRIGELVDIFKAAGEWDDTVLIILGDHGENIGEHSLMDHQYCLYDTLLHVPLVIHGGEFMGGETVDDLVQLTDIAPTILDIAGVEGSGITDKMQGESFHPASDATPRKYLYAEYMAPQPSIEALEKRINDISEDVYEYDRSIRMVRDKNWKYIRYSDGTEELYDLQSDIGELANLVGSCQDVVDEYNDKLDDWLRRFEEDDENTDANMSENIQGRLEDLGYLQ